MDAKLTGNKKSLVDKTRLSEAEFQVLDLSIKESIGNLLQDELFRDLVKL